MGKNQMRSNKKTSLVVLHFCRPQEKIGSPGTGLIDVLECREEETTWRGAEGLAIFAPSYGNEL